MTQDEKDVGYTAQDQMIVSAARQIKDDDILYVGVGLPMLSAMFAKHNHAPNRQCLTS